LKAHNSTKDFKKFSAVKNLNMNIKQGEIYGFLIPDKTIQISIDDYVNKKDPVLDYIIGRNSE
jgi:ABC-type uncharacterized transport system ATPase subunit